MFTDIVYQMKRLTGAGAREIKNAKMLKEFQFLNEISIVGFFDSPDNHKIWPYKDLCKLASLAFVFYSMI